MDVLTFLSVLYLFYTMHLANQKLHERSENSETLVINIKRPNYTTEELKGMLRMSDEDFHKRYGMQLRQTKLDNHLY